MHVGSIANQRIQHFCHSRWKPACVGTYLMPQDVLANTEGAQDVFVKQTQSYKAFRPYLHTTCRAQASCSEQFLPSIPGSFPDWRVATLGGGHLGRRHLDARTVCCSCMHVLKLGSCIYLQTELYVAQSTHCGVPLLSSATSGHPR